MRAVNGKVFPENTFSRTSKLINEIKSNRSRLGDSIDLL